MAPPIEPGMHAKNSNPVNEFANAKSAIFLSKVAAPASIILEDNRFRWENWELSFIVIPLTPPSLISVFDPAPKIVMFFALTFLKKKNYIF